MSLGGTNSGHDTFTHSGNNGVFRSTTNQAVDIGTHCHTSLGKHLDTILRHRCDLAISRTINHFWVHTRLHGLENVPASEINSTGAAKIEIQVRAIRSNQRPDDPQNIAASEVMGFQIPDTGIFQASLHRANPRPGNGRRVHLTQRHSDQAEQANVGLGQGRLDIEVDELRNEDQENYKNQNEDAENPRPSVINKIWNGEVNHKCS